MGCVGNREEVTESVTSYSRLRRRRGFGRRFAHPQRHGALGGPAISPHPPSPWRHQRAGFLFGSAWVILSLGDRGWRHVAPRSEYIPYLELPK